MATRQHWLHDPDEYIAKGRSQEERTKLYDDVLSAYRALQELKQDKKVKAIGIGSKDWRIIQKIVQDIELDWVMIANSMTVHSHPPELVDFLIGLKNKGVTIINSAVLNGGFLTGSDFYNYQPVSPESHRELYQWRTDFYRLCKTYQVKPADVCASFGLNAPGITSIALNTTNPTRIADNVAMANIEIPTDFWNEMKQMGLIDYTHSY